MGTVEAWPRGGRPCWYGPGPSASLRPMPRDYVTIVSGLPRSGTSMMMKMLDAGGLVVVTDNVRTADEDNTKGYYEFERVKKI